MAAKRAMTKFFDFTVKDIKNNDWDLSQLKGKVQIEIISYANQRRA